MNKGEDNEHSKAEDDEVEDDEVKQNPTEAEEDIEDDIKEDIEKLKEDTETKLMMAQASIIRLKAEKVVMEQVLEEREWQRTNLNSRVEEKQSEGSELGHHIEVLKARLKALKDEQQKDSELHKKVTELKVRNIEECARLEEEVEKNAKADQQLVQLRKKLVEMKLKNELIVRSLVEEHEDKVTKHDLEIEIMHLANTRSLQEKELADQELAAMVRRLEEDRQAKQALVIQGTMIQQQILGSTGRLTVMESKIRGGPGLREGLEEVVGQGEEGREHGEEGKEQGEEQKHRRRKKGKKRRGGGGGGV